MNAPTQSRNTAAELIFDMWQGCIDAVPEDADVPVPAIQSLIASTRSIMTDAGWPPVFQHDFFVGLAKLLKAGSARASKIIWLLEIETELN